MNRWAFQALAIVWILSGNVGETSAASPTPLAPSLSHGGLDLVLRSTSLKEATFFKVNVYWVGLYLEIADTPPDSVISSNQTKAFVFHFLRDVKSTKLQEAWIQDLTDACVSDCIPVIAQGRILARNMPDVRSSQKITYVLLSDRVDVLIDGNALGSLVGASATRAILATFLGPEAPTKLRKELIALPVAARR